MCQQKTDTVLRFSKNHLQERIGDACQAMSVRTRAAAEYGAPRHWLHLALRPGGARFSLLDRRLPDGRGLVSSEKIHALCPAEINSRAIRRSLAKMEGLGWLKRFCVRGRRGNYAVVIARYFVRDASGSWMSVNAERTTDWRNVQFDPVHEPSSLMSEPDRERVGEPVGGVSGIKEVRREETKTKKGNPQSAVALSGQSSKDFENRKIITLRSETIKQVYFQEFEKHFHLQPDFDGSDGKGTGSLRETPAGGCRCACCVAQECIFERRCSRHMDSLPASRVVRASVEILSRPVEKTESNQRGP